MNGIEQDLCRDAVVVLPGIMGSELVEADTGTVLWGIANPGWYVKAWTSGSSLQALAVTEDERNGRVGRVKATRTLRVPAFAPILRGFEPYSAMLAAVKRFVVHDEAVQEFAYDWRLAIHHNATELAKVAEEHLRTWRQHAKGSRDARLVLVAHSMGGLVARYFTSVLGGASDVRATVTLGTPFHGAAKAVVLLSTGHGAPLPLPHERLRRLAHTMPGVHDLLPTYRCVDEGDKARLLTPSDISALGGDRELAEQAFDRRTKLLAGSTVGLHATVGVQQPTMQSLSIADGVAEPLFHTCLDAPDGSLRRVDKRGDGTVYRDAAAPAGVDASYLPQSHSDLAKSEEAIAHACAVMTETRLGPPLGEGGVGLELPDVVPAGETFELIAKDVDDPAAVTCNVEQVLENRTQFVDTPHFGRPRDASAAQNPSLVAKLGLPKPGLYRIEVRRGAPSPITQLVLAVAPGDLANPHRVGPDK